MSKIVIEIDGVRHKLNNVSAQESHEMCLKCSLFKECKKNVSCKKYCLVGDYSFGYFTLDKNDSCELSELAKYLSKPFFVNPFRFHLLAIEIVCLLKDVGCCNPELSDDIIISDYLICSTESLIKLAARIEEECEIDIDISISSNDKVMDLIKYIYNKMYNLKK